MDMYAVQRLVGKIDDVAELREEFIKIFDTKSKQQLAVFGLSLAEHIIDTTGFEAGAKIATAFDAVREWLDGKTNYHKARTLAGAINDLARDCTDPVGAKFYRTMAQIACIPHVHFHALWACDFAIALTNRLHPGDLEAVRSERETHILLCSKAVNG